VVNVLVLILVTKLAFKRYCMSRTDSAVFTRRHS